LGRHTADHRLVFYVPTWYDWHPPWPDGTTGADGPLLRGGAVPAGAFLVIQTGGFNTWLDVETLFAALEAAMAANQQVHFAATGGAIQGHYVEGYERFEREIKSSRYNNRYHILGWRPLGELPRLLAEADLAINLDRPGPEGILGCRNRMLDWVAAGVPTVTTPGCELAVELADGGFVTLTPHGNPAAAARAILAVAADPEPYRAAARRGAAWLARERTATVCMRPILEWAAAPQSALDLQAWRSGEAEPPRLWRRASQAPENLAAMRRQAQKAAWLEQKLARMEGSRWVRLALWLRGRDDLEPPSGGW
jgi:glycosyltransferase involved in cell wall biosynthesis